MAALAGRGVRRIFTLSGNHVMPVFDATLGSGIELIHAGDLERAVHLASQRARPGEVVLLAPACASFDQYRDYEERGEHFRTLVQGLAR